jgi:hypothetical protein
MLLCPTGLERVREAATLRRQIPKMGARCVNHADRDDGRDTINIDRNIVALFIVRFILDQLALRRRDLAGGPQQ